MTGFAETISIIEKNLSQALPGKAAQNRMAPCLPGGIFLSRSPNSATRNSAVMITLFPDNNQTNTLLIKRPVYEGPHSGQVSFPGGKSDESDIDITHTALRETHEEIGIKPQDINVVGTLTPLFVPVSNLMVYPIVGVLKNKPNLFINVQEVEYTIQAAIYDFKKTENRSVKTLSINKIPISAPYYSVGGEDIWGITAMILSEFTCLF